MPIVAAHGGSSSRPDHKDGPELACEAGRAEISHGQDSLAAVIAATSSLEDDERFNAGTGSNLRLDGKTIQMDASSMTSLGAFGAVAAIERVKNPVQVARHVMNTPHVLLVGSGATEFARAHSLPDYDPTTEQAQERFRMGLTVAGPIGEWSRDDLAEAWNFETPLREVLGSDTVGAVAWDGKTFAAALSSGGTSAALRGRVGDVPLPGCGLYAGVHGAIALTGDGEHFARSLLAFRAYQELERGKDPEQVAVWVLGQLPDEVDVGIIAINRTRFAGRARHGMAWHGTTA